MHIGQIIQISWTDGAACLECAAKLKWIPVPGDSSFRIGYCGYDHCCAYDTMMLVEASTGLIVSKLGKHSEWAGAGDNEKPHRFEIANCDYPNYCRICGHERHLGPHVEEK
jgi:hypothetical protein